jgi:hypothetical protein
MAQTPPRCGAMAVGEPAHDGLLASGEHLDAFAPRAVNALTSGELRVPDLAVNRLSTREIAETLSSRSRPSRPTYECLWRVRRVVAAGTAASVGSTRASCHCGARSVSVRVMVDAVPPDVGVNVIRSATVRWWRRRSAARAVALGLTRSLSLSAAFAV